MVITRKERMLIFIMIILLLGFVAFRFALAPGREELGFLEDQNVELSDKKIALTTAVQQPKDQSLEDIKAAQEKELQMLQAKLPESVELMPLLRFIQAITIEHHVTIINLDIKEATPKPPEPAAAEDGTEVDPTPVPEEITFTLTTAGTVNALTLFMESLADGSRLLTIERAAVTARKKDNTQNMAPPPNFNILEPQIPSYYIPPPDVPSALGQRVPPTVETPVQQPVTPIEVPQTQSTARAADFIKGEFQLELTLKAYFLKPVQPEEDATAQKT